MRGNVKQKVFAIKERLNADGLQGPMALVKE